MFHFAFAVKFYITTFKTNLTFLLNLTVDGYTVVQNVLVSKMFCFLSIKSAY